MKDIRRDNLHHNREAHAGGELRGFRCGFGDGLLRNRNAVGVAHQFALGRGQARAFVRLDHIQYFADRISGTRHWLPP